MDFKNILAVILAGLFFSGTSLATEGPPTLFVIGEVSEMAGGLVTMKTDEGIERDFTLKMAEEKGISGLKVGDRLLLEINPGNLIVDIEHLSEKGVVGKGQDKLRIVGRVVGTAEDRERITLRIPNGEEVSYSFEPHLAGKVSRIKKGSVIKVEIPEGKDRVHGLTISR